ncbi:MAG: LysR family transcriptional regulator [Myxococcales bacterium]|nr:LysR family transcriptional regulator [Myxococcales bacterium]
MNSVQQRPALELRHHELMAAVAEEGSLAAATRRLHLSASALSHQLRDAETKLGVSLFLRRNRRLILTAAGERLLQASRRLLDEARRAESSVSGQAQEIIRVSTGCYTAYSWLAPALTRFGRAHPDVDVRIELDATRRPVSALLRGELDLALTSDVPRSSRLRSMPLFSDELILLVPRDHRLARAGVVRAEDLRREHVIVYDAPREDLDVFTKVLWPAGVEPMRVSRIPLTEAMVELVRAGAGVAVLVGWAVPKDPALVRVKLAGRGLLRRWRAVTLRRRRPWPALHDLVQLISARPP